MNRELAINNPLGKKPARLHFALKALPFIVILFLGYHTYSHPLLFSLTPILITPVMFKTITWQSRAAIFCYALGASFLSFKPVGDVLGDGAIFEQIAACLLLAIISALPWLIITGTGKKRLLTSILACLIAILPPMGTIAAPNPYMAAGYLFPGTGLFGLALIASIIILPFHLKEKLRKYYYIGVCSLAIISNIIYVPPTPPDDWVGVVTRFPDSDVNPLTERYKRSRILLSQITSELDQGKKVIVTAESVLGQYTPSLEPLLALISARAKRHKATVLTGIIEQDKDGNYENSLLILGMNEGRYNARQPVPFIMWQLWQGDSFKSHWFDDGVHDIAGKKAAILICWEEWVPWPMLLSSFEKPDVIISASNHGWTREGEIMWDRQTISAKAIGRLYGLPMVRAINLQSNMTDASSRHQP